MPSKTSSNERPGRFDQRSHGSDLPCINETPLEETPFFRRKTLGVSYRLWIGILSLALLAMVPNGALHTLQDIAYNANHWKTSTVDPAEQVPRLAAEHLLIGWDSIVPTSTAGSDSFSANIEAEKLKLFRQKLAGLTVNDSDLDKGSWPWFPRIERYPSSDIRADQAESPVCLVAYLSPKLCKQAPTNSQPAPDKILATVRQLAVEECGIPAASLHLGGKFAQRVAFRQQSVWFLSRATIVGLLISMLLAYLFLRDEKLTALLLLVAVSASAMSLAVVYYGGLLMQVEGIGVLSSVLPLFVLGIVASRGFYLINDYQQALKETSKTSAASRALWMSWKPAAMSLLCLAIGFISLTFCDLLAVRKFGVDATVAIVLGIGLIQFLLPASLDFLASKGLLDNKQSTPGSKDSSLFVISVNWFQRLNAYQSTSLLIAGCLMMAIFIAKGITSLPQAPLGELLLSASSQAGSDLAWFAEQFGAIDPLAQPVSEAPTSASFGLSQSLQMSLLITLVTIACMGIARWNHSMAGLVILLPALTSLGVALGIAGWTQQPLGIGLLLSVGGAIGISLMGTLPFLHHFQIMERKFVERHEAIQNTIAQTAPAATCSTLVLLAGLAPLLFCSIAPMQQMGLLLMLVSATSLVSNLTLLPRLLVGFAGNGFSSKQISAFNRNEFSEEVASQPAVKVDTEIEEFELEIDTTIEEIQLKEIDLAFEPGADEAVAEKPLEEVIQALESTKIVPTEKTPIAKEPKTLRLDSAAALEANDEPLSIENESLRRRLRSLRRSA